MKINSIFESISGEGGFIPQGTWCTFIRTQGCSLRCAYCFGVKRKHTPELIYSNGVNKRIDHVQVGDQLLTFNGRGDLTSTEVVDFIERDVKSWLMLRINDRDYMVTPEHPFFTTRGIIAAENLRVDDRILHSSGKQKISFMKQGDRNPMKDPLVANRSFSNHDYLSAGRKVSRTIRRKMEQGIYESAWSKLSVAQQEVIRQANRKRMLGENNPNWGGGLSANYVRLKNKVQSGEITKCAFHAENTPVGMQLDVHHKDEDRQNDDPQNLIVLCHSCHSGEHQIGYNFWRSKRVDGRTFKGRIPQPINGFEVQSIRRERSLGGSPLRVFNIRCSPYNSYLVDWMWVHNCDTVQAQDHKVDGREMAIREIVGSVQTKFVLVTGGEPLEQLDTLPLLQVLQSKDHVIQIETSGHLPPVGRPDTAFWVVDYKCPSSKMVHRMAHAEQFIQNWKGYLYMIKLVTDPAIDTTFVIKTMQDMIDLGYSEMFLISPIDGRGEHISELASSMKRDNPSLLDRTVFSVQLHKIVGLP